MQVEEGQIWKHNRDQRQVRIVEEYPLWVQVVNTQTGRKSYMQYPTLIKHFALVEAEAATLPAQE